MNILSCRKVHKIFRQSVTQVWTRLDSNFTVRTTENWVVLWKRYWIRQEQCMWIKLVMFLELLCEVVRGTLPISLFGINSTKPVPSKNCSFLIKNSAHLRAKVEVLITVKYRQSFPHFKVSTVYQLLMHLLYIRS